MGRAERRRYERKQRIENRKDKVLMSREEIKQLKDREYNNSSKYTVEALMTCFAIAEHRRYHFGQKRILRTLQEVDDIMGDILNGSTTVEELKQHLEDAVGVVIKCE